MPILQWAACILQWAACKMGMWGAVLRLINCTYGFTALCSPENACKTPLHNESTGCLKKDIISTVGVRAEPHIQLVQRFHE